MRAAAIFGLGCSVKNLKPFQSDESIQWCVGIPDAADPSDVILLFGGDGTIHRYLSLLVKLGWPVLVVPTGSGNDFARALGLRSVGDAVMAWRRFCSTQENVRAIDLAVITPLSAGAPASEYSGNSTPGVQHYFCSVAGLGLDGEVARRTNALPRWLRGHGGYALTLFPTIFGFAPVAVRISTSDGAGGWTIRSDQPTMLAAFANTSTYGGGMKIAPHANSEDGQLDVCVVAGIDPFKLACLLPTVYFGRHLGIREVKYFQAAHLRVETGTPLEVYADGECVCRTPVELALRREALKVLTLRSAGC